MPVSANYFSSAAVLSYGLAFIGYGAFAARIALGSRGGLRARLLVFALGATAAWSACSIWLALVGGLAATIATDALEACRYIGWFAFLWLLTRDANVAKKHGWANRVGMIAVTVLLVASPLIGQDAVLGSWAAGLRTTAVMRLVIAVVGLVLVERLVRRIQPHRRWAIKPLAIGLAALFSLDLFYYAYATMIGGLDGDLWLARGCANFIVIPCIAVATARNSGWTVDLHFSRSAVFHSSALLMSGVFLLAVAGAGYLVRYVGGDWGRALQIEFLFSALLFLVLVVTSGRFRAALKVFVSKHFFSYRYDYREEWLRFTRTLADESEVHSLQTRTIIALADLVESPGGALWLKDESRGYVSAATWNVTDPLPIEPTNGSLATFLEKTNWVISLPEYMGEPSRYENLAVPESIASLQWPWLIVPLISRTAVIGFVILMKPRTTITIDWEVRDLLKAASRQAASYLGQVRATETLIEVRKFDAFNRMSAFVVHDLKNLVAQLTLMLKNAQRHRDNPEFQADMLATVGNVVARMNALMLQLRTGNPPVDSRRNVDLHSVVSRVCNAKSTAHIAVEVTGNTVSAPGHEDRLEHVIGHLVQNAIDASPMGSRVRVRVQADGEFALVVVSDRGLGMTPEFVRDHLFKPFETTKTSGMGIGVYESSQYVASLGGEIRVESRPGEGTEVFVRLPRGESSSPSAVVPITEAA